VNTQLGWPIQSLLISVTLFSAVLTESQARAGVLFDRLRVSEIMYHPADPSSAEDAAGYTAQDFEFLELQNASANSIGLRDVQVVGGVSFTFPVDLSTTLGPGEFAVLVKNVGAFTARYSLPGGTFIGEYSGNLSDSGEKITLLSSLDQEEFTFHDVWYPETDGAGFSLVRVDPFNAAADPNLALSWRASSFLGGDPGVSINPSLVCEPSMAATWLIGSTVITVSRAVRARLYLPSGV
jgi:hypothetical protein